jgi:RNA polymerase sigma-70 factor (ECF subfamily)
MPQEATRATIAELVEHHRAFRRFVELRVGDRAVAEDIIQEAFGRAVTHAETIPEETAVAWFYRVLRNAVIDHYRRHEARRRALESFARELDQVAPPPDVHDEVCRCILTAASSLKPEYAEVLRQVDVGGAPVKSFAAQAAITPGNASVRLFRAREALKRQVMTACGTCAEHGCVDCTCGKAKEPARSKKAT